MTYKEAKTEFVQIWGAMGTNWGINKAMAQIHALLLASDQPISTDEVMEELQVSRSNANLNIRALLDWGLIYKKHVPGDRREYFVAEKDIWDVAIKIMKERRKREVEPIVRELKALHKFDANTQEEMAFKTTLNEVDDLAQKLLSMGTMFEKLDKLNFVKWAIKGF